MLAFVMKKNVIVSKRFNKSLHLILRQNPNLRLKLVTGVNAKETVSGNIGRCVKKVSVVNEGIRGV